MNRFHACLGWLVLLASLSSLVREIHAATVRPQGSVAHASCRAPPAPLTIACSWSVPGGPQSRYDRVPRGSAVARLARCLARLRGQGPPQHLQGDEGRWCQPGVRARGGFPIARSRWPTPASTARCSAALACPSTARRAPRAAWLLQVRTGTSNCVEVQMAGWGEVRLQRNASFSANRCAAH